nr:hypothetical protein [Tanacetum cinerariifolium]
PSTAGCCWEMMVDEVGVVAWQETWESGIAGDGGKFGQLIVF